MLDHYKFKTAELSTELVAEKKTREREVNFYIQTAQKWKDRTYSLQGKIKNCSVCCAHIEVFKPGK